MRIVILLILFTYFFQLDNKEPLEIVWSENYKLKWEDFQGKQEGYSDEQAKIRYRFYYKILNYTDSNIVYSAKNIFVKNKSWTKNKEGNELLLNHEQRHFDLSEVYARYFRKELSELNASNNVYGWELMDKTLKNWFNKLNVVQDKYDLETGHSIEKEMQENWNKKIDSLLLSLDKYKDTIVIHVNKSRTGTTGGKTK
ncbi:MAG: hypothetical protein A2X08_14985 [Bacteroidetes bacterium GWA2_32_17]|nr:MAG: hypothetical protein A2X08_14985 [Bacteroidetes bacterium GWA2_32_17]